MMSWTVLAQDRDYWKTIVNASLTLEDYDGIEEVH